MAMYLEQIDTNFSLNLTCAFDLLFTCLQWEIMTLFAAHMGPAEVAAWGILGFLWDTFEYAIGMYQQLRMPSSSDALVSTNITLLCGCRWALGRC